MKVCVTGGAGYIGSHLVDRLVKLGHEVIVIDDLSNGSVIHPSTLLFSYDIRDIEHIKNALKGTEAFFHLAANKRATSTDNCNMISVNVDGTMAVMDIAKKVGAKKFIFSSSAAVYGPEIPIWNKDGKIHECDSKHSTPMNIYGLSKRMGEEICQFMADESISVNCLRYFNVWGGRYLPNNKVKSAIETFRERKSKGESVQIYGDGSSVRDYVHVDDVVEANIKALTKTNRIPWVWNVCTGKGTSTLDVARYECGEDYPIEFLPARSNEVNYSVGSPETGEMLDWVPKNLYGETK